MKKLLLLTCFFFITAASFSQINKGQYLVGGNASFNSTKNDGSGSKATTFQFSPDAGYFIIDKLAVGARVNLSNFKYQLNDDGNAESKTTEFGLSPFVRYYFLPKTEKLNLFADAGYAYSWVKFTSKNLSGTPGSTYTSKGNTHGYFISAGPAIFLNPNTALELTLSYNYSKLKEYAGTVNKNFMVGVGFQIHLGK